MQTPRPRKPRFQRTADPPSVRLTERDFRILELLSEHRLMQSHHLLALLAGSRQHLIRRLGALYHARLVERPKQQLQISGELRSTLAYCLAERGRSALQSRGLGVFSTVPKFRSAASAYSLTHELHVSETMVAIRTAALAKETEFLWHHEAISSAGPSGTPRHHQMRWSVSTPMPSTRSRPRTVIPDGAFCLKSGDGNLRWFFLEFDRGTMPVVRSNPEQTSFVRKIHAYRQTRHAGILWKRFEISGYRVLVVTESQKRLRSLQQATAECFQRGESSMFLFTCRSELNDPAAVLEGAWETCSGKKIGLLPDLSTSDPPSR